MSFLESKFQGSSGREKEDIVVTKLSGQILGNILYGKSSARVRHADAAGKCSLVSGSWVN